MTTTISKIVGSSHMHADGISVRHDHASRMSETIKEVADDDGLPLLSDQAKVVVVGVGYVGLPLAVALSRHFHCVGFDVSMQRIRQLQRGCDQTGEITSEILKASKLRFSPNIEDCRGAACYIVTVPTPVDEDNNPDLEPILSATKALAGILERGQRAIIVYESTVYPGVTEDICGPVLEEFSGLERGRDFFLGYSPERINPGDKENTVDQIAKVIAGESASVSAVLVDLYGRVTKGGIVRAPSIKVAEAAKLMENAQRDVNIAFINETTQIFKKMGLSIHDILEVAGTKWNFIKLRPGLVGGHCICVDPYYLSYKAQQIGYEPKLILAGRDINNGMSRFIADQIHGAMQQLGSVLVLGLTFKENVPDLRNSKVVDLVRRLESFGHSVTVHDPFADPADALDHCGLYLDEKAFYHRYDAVVLAVAHSGYCALSSNDLAKLVHNGGLVADVKNIWHHIDLPSGIKRWSL